MASTYTVNLGIEKIGTGEQSGTWGNTTNTNFDLIDQAVNGAVTVTLASAGTSGSPNSLVITNGAASDGRNKFIEFNDGGDLGATAYVQLDPNDAEKIVHMRNSLSGGRSVIVFQGTYNASNDFEIPNGKDVVLKFDGAGASATVTDVFTDLQATAITTPSLTATNLTATGTTTLAGASTTADITFGDNDKAIFGAGSDLQIYHNGSNSFVDDAGTGDLYIRSNRVFLGKYTGEVGLSVLADGAVNLNYDNAQKLATTATGIDVTGTVTADGLAVSTSSAVTAQLGRDGSDGDVLQIYNGAIGTTKALALGVDFTSGIIESQFGNIDIKAGSALAAKFASGGDISFYEDTGTTPKFFWDASAERLGLGTTSPERVLHAVSGQQVVAVFESLSSTAGRLGVMDSTTTGSDYVGIGADGDDLKLYAGGSNPVTITTTNVGIGVDTPGLPLEIKKNGAGETALLRLRSDDGADQGFLDISVNATNNETIYTSTGSSRGQHVFNDGITERMRIDSGGRVGIANSSPASLWSQAYQLVVGGGGGNIGMSIYGSSVGSSRIAFVDTTAGTPGLDSGGLITYSHSSDVFAFRVAGSDAMHITSAGDVGIGTSSPASDSGYTGLTLSGSTGAQVVLQDDGTTEGLIWTNNAFNIEAESTNPMVFRTNGSERMRIDSSGSVGIGVSSPSTLLELGGSNTGSTSDSPVATLRLTDSDTSTALDQPIGKIEFYGNDGTVPSQDVMAYILSKAQGSSGGGDLRFGVCNNTVAGEAMRLDGGGNLLVGRSSAFSSSRVEIQSAGSGGTGASECLTLNNTGADGNMLEFYKAGTRVGSISVDSAELVIDANNVVLSENGTQKLSVGAISLFPITDNSFDLGTSGNRYDDIFATNGTIQTSDANDKQDIAELDEAERRVAVAAKGLLRKFRWKDSVAEKGDEARIHFGIIAQDLQAAFEAEGLDAGRYAMFIHSTWTDEETGEERSRMGVRYSELLAFIIAAL